MSKPIVNRWEKFVNRRWNEALGDNNNFEEFIMANNPSVPDFQNISLDEKEHILRELNYIGGGVKISEIKNLLKNTISDDLNYSRVTDATQDQYEITNEDGTSLKYGVDGMVDEVMERLMSFMPNSSSVEVKKKCKLGGNGDGTSEPCNKGDINNLTIKTLKENRVTTNVGFFDVDDAIAPSKDSLFISHLEINPELRGQGHFKELLNIISQEAKKRGKDKIVFDPDITQGKEYLNKLISIYKHHGFKNDLNDPSLLVKNLNENNDEKRTPDWILGYINKLHKNGWEKKEFEDPEWVRSDDYYQLEEIELDDPRFKWVYMPAIYSKLSTEIPPIVISSNGYIIDGMHRAGTAKKNGLKKIKAYVGYKISENLNEFNNAAYSKWKRDNVTYRGISDNADASGENGGSAVLGRGLYSVPASNKSMARTYGKLAMLVNARPKKPKIFNTLNDWEIWYHNTLVFPYSKAKGKDYPDQRDFSEVTNIETEMQKLGYDGIIIKGREMVNFKPENVRYYYNENQLINYYENTFGDISESVLNENHRDDLQYGALMAIFPVPNWNKIVSIIDKEDVYDKPGFGLEKEPHVTLLYGFHDDVDADEVLERVTENLDDVIDAEILNISIFESKEYDVVKFDIKSKILHDLNKICKEFPFTSDFPEYHPHMTIAYVKKGKGKKYVKDFSKSYKIVSDELVFSTKDKEQNKVKIDEAFLFERKSRFDVLKDNKKPLSDEERKEVMDADAVWHFSTQNKPSPAVWKSVNKKGEVTYVTNTHRAYNTAKTLKGAINMYHKFIKGTA